MGEFTLGCLLGQYDRAQSFDINSDTTGFTNINSWDIDSSVNKIIRYHFADTVVHSSKQGLLIDVLSWGFGDTIMVYEYGQDNDIYQRWSPDVTTHDISLDFWGVLNVPDSGTVGVSLLSTVNTTQFIAGDGLLNPQHYKISTTVHSTSTNIPRVRVFRETFSGSASLRLDDFLLTVDPIVIHPMWNYRERQELQRFNNKTLGAIQHTYIWDKHFAWNVPLHFLSTSHANLINWWWQNQFNLLFTLNTSDSESMYVTRIVNDQQPINRRIRPDENLWSGNIFLESIDKGSLVF